MSTRAQPGVDLPRTDPLKEGQRKVLRAVTLEIRHILEGYWSNGVRLAGDLEQRLRSLGVRPDGTVVPVDELTHLPAHDVAARVVVDAWLTLRLEAGASGAEAVEELVRETAWSWANRLLALRCMEARGVIEDEVIVTKAVYAGRSMLHNRLIRKRPELEREEDGGLFTTLSQASADLVEHLPRAFDPAAPGIALRPSVAALTQCIGLLSGTQRPRGQEAATDAVFQAPDALGWAYQYWNTEEKQRVFDLAAGKGPDRKRHKIEEADIIPATQLYTEPYMVQFLVQNSLGGLWASMHPDTSLVSRWPYFVAAAERPTVAPRPVREITFLDPACGSGHFLLEAFDVFFSMYREEDPGRDATMIAADILTRNLHGLDIDERAVHIAEVALWMKAAEATAKEGRGFPLAARANLVATNVHLPRGQESEIQTGGPTGPNAAKRASEDGSNPRLNAFLKAHPEDEPLRKALSVVFKGLEHADELGALLQLDEPVDKELRRIKEEGELEAANADAKTQLRLFRHGEQTVLPLTARTFADWRGDVIARVRDHFSEEALSSDPVQAYFGRSAERALDVFDVLSQHYDVVAANPPYMGSKNMGPVLHSHVGQYYSEGKRDLYAAFVLRCLRLLAPSGRFAFVAQQSWMFQSSYADFRGILLRHSSIESLAHLGSGAFEEISGEVVSTAMCCLRNDAPTPGRAIAFIRAVDSAGPSAKAALLRELSRSARGRTVLVAQTVLQTLPGSPLVYWVSSAFLELLAAPKRLSSEAQVLRGLDTGKVDRWIRFHWEVPQHARWSWYSRGGGYSKWCGLEWTVVEWQADGARIDAKGQSIVPSRHLYGLPGLTYTDLAQGRLSVRVLPEGFIFSDGGPLVASTDEGIAGILNARLSTYLMRLTCPSPLHYRTGYVANLPVVAVANNLRATVRAATQGKVLLVEADPIERRFRETKELAELFEAACDLHRHEGEIERLVCDAFGLGERDVGDIVRETGVPAGWLGTTADSSTVERVRDAFEAGPGATKVDEPTEEDEDDGEEGEAQPGTLGRPIPPETFLEELSQLVGLEPRTVLRIVQDGLANGWRCASEERRLAADRVTVLVLRLLGHRWPLEIERDQPIPDWADADGVVPLTSIPHERPMIERLRARWAAEGTLESELSAALDMPADQWLQTRFAAWHTSQFKKRPAAWQLESSHGRRPAFAALIYAQRVSTEMLASIRSQYVGPLTERRRQEVRTLEAAGKRNAEQEQQLKDAGLAVAELERFAEALITIEREGFATPGLREIVIQDALQSLIQPLLGRWRTELGEGPVREWAAAGRVVDESLAVALYKSVEALPLSAAEWASLVKAPKWKEDAPAAAAVRDSVVDATDALVRVATDRLRTALDGAFGKWKRARREEAALLGKRAPKFKAEDALVESIARRIRGWRPEVDTLPRFVRALPILDAWCAEPGRPAPSTLVEFVRQESAWRPDVNDGVRVNIAPLQRAGLLAENPLASKDIESAIADRAIWRADERRWVRAGKLPQPGWWPKESP